MPGNVLASLAVGQRGLASLAVGQRGLASLAIGQRGLASLGCQATGTRFARLSGKGDSLRAAVAQRGVAARGCRAKGTRFARCRAGDSLRSLSGRGLAALAAGQWARCALLSGKGLAAW